MILITLNGKALQGSRSYTLVTPAQALQWNKHLSAWFKWYKHRREQVEEPSAVARAALEVKRDLEAFDKGEIS